MPLWLIIAFAFIAGLIVGVIWANVEISQKVRLIEQDHGVNRGYDTSTSFEPLTRSR